MKIAATMVSMDAARNYMEVDQTNTIMQQRLSGPNSINQPRPDISGHPFQQNLFSLIQSSSASQQSSSFSVTPDTEIAEDAGTTESYGQQQLKSDAFSSMVQHISGTSVTMHQLRENIQNQLTAPPPLAIGMASLSSSAFHYEEESVFFQAAGEVKTEDGRAISFNLGLQMERQELIVQSAGLGGGIFGIDPLVLNFDDTISIFDENYFSFDLDGDGEKEELSTLGSCCGFLALDRNGDGKVTDGLELFGPSTNSGFGELAELDVDGNAWIDENDPIFDDLMVWMGAGGEEDQLISLREAGVGAISVAHLGTQFNLEDSEGTVQGIVQASGLFLMENGQPKSMMGIDLVPQLKQEEDTIVSVNPETTDQIETPDPLEPLRHNSIENLQEIIFWQQMKMQMLFGKKFLSQSHNDMVDRLQHLSSRMTLSMLS